MIVESISVPTTVHPKWHHRQRIIIFELSMHSIADTCTDKNNVGINVSSSEGGRIADGNCLGHNFYFIADADTEVGHSNNVRYEFGQTVHLHICS